MWSLIALLVIVGLVALYRSPAFTIERVEIEGVERRTEDEIRARAQVAADATLLRFPADEVRERLLADPWIADASVSRDFPDTMRISVTERQPTALLDTGEDYWLVDPEGFVLERHALEETSALVLIRDVSGVEPTVGRRSGSDALRNALDVLTGLSQELKSRTRAVSAPSVDETALFTDEGVEVLFGVAEQVDKKDLVARGILAEQEDLVVFIDVRDPDRPVWRGLEQ